MGHHGGCRATAATMVGVFLLFSHIKNAQCTDSYMKKGGQIKMSILTFFPARSWRNFFSSCAAVTGFGSGRKLVLVLHTYAL